MRIDKIQNNNPQFRAKLIIKGSDIPEKAIKELSDIVANFGTQYDRISVSIGRKIPVKTEWEGFGYPYKTNGFKRNVNMSSLYQGECDVYKTSIDAEYKLMETDNLKDALFEYMRKLNKNKILY